MVLLICLYLLLESLAAMKKLRRTQDTHDVNREFNDIYRALTSDAKLGDGWIDLLASRSICLRLVSYCHDGVRRIIIVVLVHVERQTAQST